MLGFQVVLTSLAICESKRLENIEPHRAKNQTFFSSAEVAVLPAYLRVNSMPGGEAIAAKGDEPPAALKNLTSPEDVRFIVIPIPGHRIPQTCRFIRGILAIALNISLGPYK